MAKKFTIRKYNGDDFYSWAVFRSKDVKGLGKQIFWGQAQSIVSGCSKLEAKYYVKDLERGKR